jgi:hypothetical protein
MLFVSDLEKKKVFNLAKKILEGLQCKTVLYNNVIKIGQEFALMRLRKIVANTTVVPPKPTGKKIVFNNVHGTYLEALYKEAGIAKALQLRGHEVKMLLCGGTQTACTALFTISIPPNQGMCRNCKYFSKKFFDIVGLPYATYFDYLSSQEIQAIKDKVSKLSLDECKNYVHKNVNIGFHATTSVQRFYKGSDPEKSKYSYVTMFRTQLVNAIISVDVAEKVVSREKPDRLYTSHGCYSNFGSFSEYFNRKGIRTTVWYTGYKKNSLILDFDKLHPYFLRYVTARKRKTLTPDEEKELDTYLNLRTNATSESGDTYLYGFSSEDHDLRKQFNVDQYDKTIIVFPNVPWDISLLNADKAYNDVYTWISETIKLFQDKPNIQLIIKIHPSEVAVMESAQTVMDYINTTFPQLPSNISVIPPDTTISPYALLPLTDVGVVFNGTIGLEMAIIGIPVIVVGNTHYGDKGFTYDVASKKDYEKLLFEDIPKLSVQKIRQARLYGYFYFIKSYVPLNILAYKSFLNHGWNINSFDDIAKGKDFFLDHICNYIVSDEIFQNW